MEDFQNKSLGDVESFTSFRKDETMDNNLSSATSSLREENSEACKSEKHKNNIENSNILKHTSQVSELPPPETGVENTSKVTDKANSTISVDQKEKGNSWITTMALCLAIFSQTYLLISVFTYAGFMTMHLIPDLTEQTAGSYAGFVSGIFMVGRTISAYFWGSFADTFGRKSVFYCSYAIAAVCSLWFGMSNSIGMALSARFIMGLGNGLLLVIKTVVTELAKGDRALEARTMGLVVGMWGWGYLAGPVISGVLSDPVKQYPHSQLVHYFKPFLSKYPFLLPNIVSVIFCLIGAISVHFFVEETLPKEKIKSVNSVLKESWGNINKFFYHKSKGELEELLPLRDVSQKESEFFNSQQSLETAALSATDDSSYGSKNDGNDGFIQPAELLSTESKPPITIEKVCATPTKQTLLSDSTTSTIWSNDSTRYHLIGYWTLSFSAILVDEAFPLFCIATKAGLSLHEKSIGKILSGAGLIFVFCQYIVYSQIMSRYGIYKSMLIGSVLATPICILIPIALYLNRGAETQQLSWSSYIFLCAILGIRNIGVTIAFSIITIATNETVPATLRARMNGISMLGGSLAKALGPACAGILVSSLMRGRFFAPIIGVWSLFTIMSVIGLSFVIFVVLKLRKYHIQD